MRDVGTSYDHASGWQEKASCSSAGLPPEEVEERVDLFAQRTLSELRAYREPSRHPKVRQALEFCARCPVIDECAAYPRTEPDYPLVGVWGGRYIGWNEALANLAAAHRTGRKTRNTRRKYE